MIHSIQLLCPERHAILASLLDDEQAHPDTTIKELEQLFRSGALTVLAACAAART